MKRTGKNLKREKSMAQPLMKNLVRKKFFGV
jgi:hypothetical protein